MTSTYHTGVVVSAKEADAWHAVIKAIMADRKIPFEQAVDFYIRRNAGRQSAKYYKPV